MPVPPCHCQVPHRVQSPAHRTVAVDDLLQKILFGFRWHLAALVSDDVYFLIAHAVGRKDQVDFFGDLEGLTDSEDEFLGHRS